MTREERPPAGPRGGGPSPELVGGLAVVLMGVVILAVTTIGMRPATGSSTDVSPTPSTTASPTATSSPLVDPTVADILLSVNRQLLEMGDRLSGELGRDPFRTQEVSNIHREINALARFAGDAVTSLGTTPVALDLIDRLGAVYGSAVEIATTTLDASINNTSAYRAGSEAMLEAFAPLPGLQKELQEVREGASATPTPAPPTASPTAGASASPTSAPTEEPTASPTASADPSLEPSGLPGPTGPSQVVNGGFESGVGAPWVLDLAATARATLVEDRQNHATGERAARVEILDPTPAFAGVTLRQPGLRIEAGARYTINVSLRSASPREIRVQLMSEAGETYLTRVAIVGTTWSVVSFTFTAPSSDDDAVLGFGLGRTAVTTWLDDVALVDAGAGS